MRSDYCSSIVARERERERICCAHQYLRCTGSVVASAGSLANCQENAREDTLELAAAGPEPESAQLDLAAVEAAGVDLLPELSDDWMAAFRG